jgi:hypothetical protein
MVDVGIWSSTEEESSFSGFTSESDSGGEDGELPAGDLASVGPASCTAVSPKVQYGQKYFDYIGENERALLTRYIREVDSPSNLLEFSGFQLQSPIADHPETTQHSSGVLLKDEHLWTVSAIEIDTDGQLFGPQLGWDDGDWYHICQDSVQVAEDAVRFAEQALAEVDLLPVRKRDHDSIFPNLTVRDVSGDPDLSAELSPAFLEEDGSSGDLLSSLSDPRGSESSFGGFRESVGATAQKLIKLRRNIANYDVSSRDMTLQELSDEPDLPDESKPDDHGSPAPVVAESSPVTPHSEADFEGFRDRIDLTAQKLLILRTKVENYHSRVSEFETRRLRNRVEVRSPVRTRSSGAVQDYPRVQPRVLEYELVAVADNEVADTDV